MDNDDDAKLPAVEGAACAAGAPRVIFKAAEAELIRRRAMPPDMQGAVAAALAEVCGGGSPPQEFAAAGKAIADAVAAHADTFGPGREPAYHNQYHQAEATMAMGWLGAAACRHGLIGEQAAAAGVLAMAGHDLQHDGAMHPPGMLEAHSAARTAALAAEAGLDDWALAVIHRVILATNPARDEAEQAHDDLLCHLAQEADLFASLTPELGWQLSRNLAQELDAAHCHPNPPVDCFAGRLRWLRAQPPSTAAGRLLGLQDAIADQIAALAAIGGGDAARGAAILDACPLAQARADYLAALAAAARA